MSKTKTLVQHLSLEEYKKLYKQLIEADAVKTSIVFNYLRQNKFSEEEIKYKMELSENAFYTICSRLTEKIDDFILESSQNKRSLLIKKVSGIEDISLKQDRVVAVSCLKKLEKDLKKNELHHELSIVYRMLKRLFFNDQKYYHYRQQYHQQNAIVIAFDELEDNLSNYVKRYSDHLLDYETNEDKTFEIYISEFKKVTEIHASNRIKILYMLTKAFHSLLLNDQNLNLSVVNDLDHQLADIEKTVKKHPDDASYQSYLLICQYLRVILCFKIDPSHRALHYLFEELSKKEHLLLGSVSSICFTNYYFYIKLVFYKKSILSNKTDLFNFRLFQVIIDPKDFLKVTTFSSYHILIFYYQKKYKEALVQFEAFYKRTSLVKFTRLSIDFKLMQAVVQFKNSQLNEARQLAKYAQRHFKRIDKKDCSYAYFLMEFILNLTSDDTSYIKNKNALIFCNSYNQAAKPLYSPLYCLTLDYTRFEVV